MPAHVLTDDRTMRDLLGKCRRIAIVGLSPKQERDSYKVALYLQKKGFIILPVRPGQKEILGEKVYSSLEDISEPVDIVNVFRRSDLVLPHAREALRLKPKLFWMQLGIENLEAVQLLTKAGVDVVMDRCIKIEHERLIG